MFTIPISGDSRSVFVDCFVACAPRNDVSKNTSSRAPLGAWRSIARSLRLVNTTLSVIFATSSLKSLGAQPVINSFASGAVLRASRNNLSAPAFPLTVHTFSTKASGFSAPLLLVPSLGIPNTTRYASANIRAIFSPSPKLAAQPWLITAKSGLLSALSIALPLKFFQGDSRIIVA